METTPEHQFSPEEKKRKFFVNVGLRARKWLLTHKQEDIGNLWKEGVHEVTDFNVEIYEKRGWLKLDEKGKKVLGSNGKPVLAPGIEARWDNISEHCIVEAARAEVFAELLGLSKKTSDSLFGGAILHDLDKKDEILSTVKKGRTTESFNEAYDKAKEKLANAKLKIRVGKGIIEEAIDRDTAEIAESVGPSSFSDAERLAKQLELTEQDIARLVLHYIDDYTLNAEPVEAYDGKQNAFDKRMEANDANKKYDKLKAAGWFEEQRRVGSLVEKRLAELLKAKGVDVEAKKIPEFVESKIKEKIERIN